MKEINKGLRQAIREETGGGLVGAPLRVPWIPSWLLCASPPASVHFCYKNRLL